MARGIRDGRFRPFHAYPRATSHTLPAPQVQPRLSESFRLAGARKPNGAGAEASGRGTERVLNTGSVIQLTVVKIF
jgi:hypothetical protein